MLAAVEKYLKSILRNEPYYKEYFKGKAPACTEDTIKNFTLSYTSTNWMLEIGFFL